MTRYLVITLALAATLALSACETDSEPLRPDSGVTTARTYYQDVRPILVENCVMCHVEGGVGPFPLTGYDEAFEVGAEMEEATRLRIMPPFLADNSGECNTWSNYRGLTDEEIGIIGDWYAQGMPEGDPAEPEPEPVALPSLPHVDVTLEMPVEYTVDETLTDDYRCFIAEVSTTEDVFVSGYDVMPGNTHRVHHVIVYSPTSEAEVTRARELDAADGNVGDGYQCFGAAVVDASPMVLWAPGTGATMFPTDSGQQSGILLPAGRAQIIQVHYNNNHQHHDVPTTDRTSIALSTVPDDCAVRPGYFFPVADWTFSLDPGQDYVETSQTLRLADYGVPAFAVIPVYGVLPHMHTLGRTLTVERISDSGEEECMIDVPRWDFHWQMAYFMNRPLRVLGTDSVRITCGFDTSEREAPVTWGEGTMDEMCLAFFYVVDPRGNCGG